MRSLTPADESWKEATLVAGWGATAVARLGELIDVLPLAGFVAIDAAGERAGLLTYALRGDDAEVVTLEALPPGRGAGRALMDAVRRLAIDAGIRRLWLVTTDDNTIAQAFYEQWGMQLAVRHADGVARSRLVKPTIPLVNADGVPLRDELELELLL